MNNGEIKFIFCTQCGAKNEMIANFCTSCGNKLTKPVFQPDPVVEETVIEDPTPIVEEIVIEEPVPIVEETAIEEPAPIVEETVIEEPAPIVEDTVIEEPVPIVEESVIEEPAPIVKEIVIEEPAPAPSSAKAKSSKISDNSHYYYNDKSNAPSSDLPPITEKPKKKKKKQNFFLKILSFLLSLVLMASLIIALPITISGLLLTDQNFDIILDRAMSSIELDKIEFSTESGTQTLSEVIANTTKELEGWEYITEEQINDVLLEDFVKDFVKDAFAQLDMSFEEGSLSIGWTPEQIYDFIEKNEDVIEELARESGYEGKLPIEENKEIILENIEHEIGEDGFSVSALVDDSDELEEIISYIDTLRALLSINTLFVAWGIVAFIAVLILFTNLGYFGSFCRACGFPAFIIGTIYFLAGMSVSPIMSIIDIPASAFTPVIEFTAGFIGALTMDISATVLVTGLVLIIISFIADAIRRKKDSKQTA